MSYDLGLYSVYPRHCLSFKSARIISLSGVQLLGFIHLSLVKIAILDIVFWGFNVLFFCVLIENTNNWMFQINNQNPILKFCSGGLWTNCLTSQVYVARVDKVHGLQSSMVDHLGDVTSACANTISRTLGHTSELDLTYPVSVSCFFYIKLLLVPLWQCISPFLFYISDSFTYSIWRQPITKFECVSLGLQWHIVNLMNLMNVFCF